MDYKQSTTAMFPVRLINSASGTPSAGITTGSVTATAKKADGTVVTLTVTGNWTEETNGAFNNSGTYYLTIPGSALDQLGLFSYAVAVSGCDPFIGDANIIAYNTNDLSTSIAGVQTTANNIYSRLGAPAGASVSADIASNLTAINSNNTAIAAVSTKLGTPAGASVSADIAQVESQVATVNTDMTTVTADVVAMNTKLGTPVGASIAVDIATVSGHAASADLKLGTPAGASVSADIASIKSDTASLAPDVTQIRRVTEGRWKVDINANTLTVYGPDGVTVLQQWNLKDFRGNPTSSNPFERVPTITIP